MKTRRLMLFLTLLGSPGLAIAQGLEMTRPDPSTDGTPAIIGGQPADIANWPATLRFAVAAGSCTSTVVGPRVVLTAAHCVDPGATGTIRIGDSAIGVACDHHDGYATDYRLDVALCLAAADIPMPADGRHETLNLAAQRPAVGQTVTLLGYGCRQAGGGGPSGMLYQGLSRVSVAATADAYVQTLGGAAVCFGDSGGGAYMTLPSGARRLFGVNSRGDIITRSLLSATGHSAIQRFIRGWRTRKNVQICGFDPMPNCR